MIKLNILPYRIIRMAGWNFPASLALLCLCLVSMPGEAKKLYKYQDEKGGWHYTDKALGLDNARNLKLKSDS